MHQLWVVVFLMLDYEKKEVTIYKIHQVKFFLHACLEWNCLILKVYIFIYRHLYIHMNI